MAFNSLIDKLFGKNDKSPKSVAKDRLKLVLMHDRADIPAPVMELIRQDIIAVLRKHLELDEDDIHINLAREDNDVALVANIPIRRVKAESGAG